MDFHRLTTGAAFAATPPFALALALSLHLLYAIFFALANFLFMKYV